MSKTPIQTVSLSRLDQLTKVLPSSINRPGLGCLKWVLVLAVLILPPVYLAKYPDHFTPLVDTLFSAFLFILAFWIGRDSEVIEAELRANNRWLPHAESVTYRLLTLYANVRGLGNRVRQGCNQTSSDLPELQTPEMKAVRVKLKTDCETSAERLNDIANQLDDAIEDWRRFIAANCQGEECSRIFLGIEQRRERLFEQEDVGPPACANHRLGDGTELGNKRVESGVNHDNS